jgi:hypothetical protein
MKSRCRALFCAAVLSVTITALAQSAYTPKFKGDPARSDSEANALGYARTVIRAERQYFKKNGKFTTSLVQLEHIGSFTKRMTEPQQGDYTVAFHPHKDGYSLLLTPAHQDAQHRSFFAQEDGVIHADEEKSATEDSPKV